MKKKKLCLVIPSLQAGGMERVMSELAGFFCKKGDLEVHMVLYGRTSEIFYQVPESLIIHVPKTVFRNRFRTIFTIGRLIFLRRKVKEINPDSILSFGEYWNSFVLLALLYLSYPLYISDRCSPEKTYSTFHSFLRGFLYPRAEGIIVQTNNAIKRYKEQFKHGNIRVIGNPIREIKDVDETMKQDIVLMVGRLIKSKNQDRLIELFLKIDVPGWRLVIVGYDHLRQNNFDRLQAIITRNKAEKKVFLDGKQAEVEEYYIKSKVFAFTSSSEGFPNAIGEAMSAGLPVVAFDCVAGPSEMIKDNENGFLVPLFNYGLFQEKLEVLMKDEELRNCFGRKAQEDVKRFSIKQIGEQYLEFILRRYSK